MVHGHPKSTSYHHYSQPIFMSHSQPKLTNNSSSIKCHKCFGYGHFSNQCVTKIAMILLENKAVKSKHSFTTSSLSSSSSFVPPYFSSEAFRENEHDTPRVNS